MFNQQPHQLAPPVWYEGSDRSFSLESTLQDLQLCYFQAEWSCLGVEIARMFEKYPLLPGVVLMEQGEYRGMISRRKLLEYLLLPHGTQLFLNHPLEVLYHYARTETLVLLETTSIIAAAGQALRRSPELLGEPIIIKKGNQSYYLLDIHELNVAAWQIRGIEAQVRYERIQAQMIQSEKMASLGRLVDGIAHEILDPVSFIWGNLTYISTYSENLLDLLQIYEKYVTEAPPEVAALKNEIEFEYLQQDFMNALQSITSGSERLKKLATSLQNFCHIDEVYPKPADIHSLLDGILLLLKSRLNNEIKIIKNYGHLPPVPCYAGQLNQVFMNIFTNAINALLNQAVAQEFTNVYSGKSAKIKQNQPQIEITTEVCFLESNQIPQPSKESNSRWVRIVIQDNGPGLSPSVQQQLLESFSVAKRAEKETSLALSYRIITSKHGGKFYLTSQPGLGTKFEILLPLT